MASLSLKHIYKKYAGGVVTVTDFNLDIKDQEFIVLVGSSGCGKSTVMRMIAGLEQISEGELYIGNRLANDVRPQDRDIAMVFQNFALYPHMTVFDNMAFGLKQQNMPQAEISRRVENAAKVVKISQSLDCKPEELSSGQSQRVALGRALAREPKVLLLDEPLSNLDAPLRMQMCAELSELCKHLNTTFLYGTQDPAEAMALGDRIVVMRDGIIQQTDTPQNLYEKPVNTFVAGFMGFPPMNFLDAKLEEKDGNFVVELDFDEADAPGQKVTIVLPEEKEAGMDIKQYVGQEVLLGIRPEHLHDNADFLATATQGILEAQVEASEIMESKAYLGLTIAGQTVIARASSHISAESGSVVSVALDVSKVHLFDKETGKAILN